MRLIRSVCTFDGLASNSMRCRPSSARKFFGCLAVAVVYLFNRSYTKKRQPPAKAAASCSSVLLCVFMVVFFVDDFAVFPGRDDRLLLFYMLAVFCFEFHCGFVKRFVITGAD